MRPIYEVGQVICIEKKYDGENPNIDVTYEWGLVTHAYHDADGFTAYTVFTLDMCHWNMDTFFDYDRPGKPQLPHDIIAKHGQKLAPLMLHAYSAIVPCVEILNRLEI